MWLKRREAGGGGGLVEIYVFIFLLFSLCQLNSNYRGATTAVGPAASGATYVATQDSGEEEEEEDERDVHVVLCVCVTV